MPTDTTIIARLHKRALEEPSNGQGGGKLLLEAADALTLAGVARDESVRALLNAVTRAECNERIVNDVLDVLAKHCRGSQQEQNTPQNVAIVVERCFVADLDRIVELQNLAGQAQIERNAWHSAALRVGENLASVGPEGYYDFTPDQWRDWALSTLASMQRAVRTLDHVADCLGRQYKERTDEVYALRAELAGYRKAMEKSQTP